MARTYTSWIVRYDDKRGMNGNLAGIITFTDGKSLKVWKSRDGEPDLHQQCKELAAYPPHDVTYAFRHSAKWGDALETITSTKADYELQEMARLADEQRGRLKPNSFLGSRIAKGNTAVTPLTQANTLPADEVPTDHESLMKKVG